MVNKEIAGKAIKSLRKRMSSREAVLLSSESDIRYFSNFYSKGEKLLILPGACPICVIDGMNKSLAEKELKGLGIRVFSSPGSSLEIISEIVSQKGIRRIFCDTSNISALGYKLMAQRLRGVELSSMVDGFSLREILDGIRAVKHPQEIAALRFAAGQTVVIWDKIARKIRPGMTELEIARMVDVLIRQSGYENSFPTIVASGPNSAFPHAIPGKRKLGRKEHVVVDFGIRHDLYCSDLTRVWGECRINGQIAELLACVQEAQKEAIRLIKPGVEIRQIAEKIDALFSRKGMGRFVMHGLGHGIGLDVHESPSFGRHSKGLFKAGMVLTVEPGLYVKGLGGVRVEDMVLVTQKGQEVLTV